MTQVIANNQSGSYTFASQPRAVQQRKKYKESWNTIAYVIIIIIIIIAIISIIIIIFKSSDQEQLSQYGNIMYDRRVIRGNTYALNTLPAVRI
jgi:radial spoke head protein 3